MRKPASKKPEDELEELLEQARDFSIDEHNDFHSLEVLSEALKDTLSRVLLGVSDVKEKGGAGEAVPPEVQQVFNRLEEAVAEGHYNDGTWEYDGTVEQALSALADLVEVIEKEIAKGK